MKYATYTFTPVYPGINAKYLAVGLLSRFLLFDLQANNDCQLLGWGLTFHLLVLGNLGNRRLLFIHFSNFLIYTS